VCFIGVSGATIPWLVYICCSSSTLICARIDSSSILFATEFNPVTGNDLSAALVTEPEIA
jgi:hypothetical protein